MFHDLRFAARIFAKSPGATAVAVLSLALAIGPNCALFSVVDRLFLKPSPVQGISQIFYLSLRTDREGQWEFLSYPDLLDYQAQAGDVGSFIAFTKEGAALNSSGQMQAVRMDLVTENYFSVLGARAAAGRTLRESDANFEGAPPAVISYSLWQRQLGGASDVVGKTLFLSGRAFSVVGILPREFRGPTFEVVPADVLSLVLREALSRVAIGTVVGLALALAAARTVTALFYQVSPADPLALATAVAVVAAVGLLAAYAPARRALRVDPMNALRYE